MTTVQRSGEATDDGLAGDGNRPAARESDPPGARSAPAHTSALLSADLTE